MLDFRQFGKVGLRRISCRGGIFVEGKEKRNILAEDFFLGETEEALCGRVPNEDSAVHLYTKDGLFGSCE